jgi:hypothetical protein
MRLHVWLVPKDHSVNKGMIKQHAQNKPFVLLTAIIRQIASQEHSRIALGGKSRLIVKLVIKVPSALEVQLPFYVQLDLTCLLTTLRQAAQ